MSLDPSTIGRYKVLGTLGAGAMGTVYLAEDPLLKRPLAIKVVREGTGDTEVLARFTREAEISARLNHPNAITVYDVGEEPQLGPYLVMEFVEGESLADRIKRGPMDPGTAAGLLLQAAGALEAVHALGILHRDIKPENFMVDRGGRLKLMDFGIARGDQGRLTSTAAFLGTPAYAAPEVLNGAGASEGSDRWSFALTAFEMLTGSLPFAGDSVGTVLYRIVHEDPVLPEGMASALRAVFERAFAKQAAERHADLKGFLRELLAALPLDAEQRQGLLANLESPTPVTSTGTLRLQLPRRPGAARTRWAWGGLGLAGLALLVTVFLRREPSRILTIDSDPGGAEVFIDGKPLGRTPLRQIQVKGRAEVLRIEKADYLPTEKRLEPGDREVALNLEPAPFKVAVASEPPGADVFLDGAPKGKAPVSVEIPGAGTHQLRLTLGGHDPWSTIPERHKPLPDPIQLQKSLADPPELPAEKPTGRKAGARKPPARKAEPAEEESKVKKFFRDLFQK